MSSQAEGAPQMVVVRGQHLRVWRREGEPGRPPLLLCNGIGVGLDHMAPFVVPLDPAIGVVAFDVPGIGGSPLPPRPYRFSGLARLAAQLVRQLGYDRFDVLGISWGGGLAQQIALQNPRRCRRLVLVSTGTGALMVPARPRVLLRMATPRRHRDRAYLQAVAGEIYGGRIRTHPELVDELFAGRSGAVSRRGYMYQLVGGVGWTSLPLLPLLRQHTLVLAGDDDPIIPLANAYLMTLLLPRSRLHIYHDGHLGLITSAGELAPVIARFLQQDPEGAGAVSATDPRDDGRAAGRRAENLSPQRARSGRSARRGLERRRPVAGLVAGTRPATSDGNQLGALLAAASASMLASTASSTEYSASSIAL